ncbi:hypothetical protein [Thermomonas sp.]|uniref:hypothetical protein n=1 Tax=Thermomonas sp. TaxID=1971895 RepID=UPI0035AF2A96
MSENTEAVKANLGEAGSHLKQAAVAAGGAVRNAAGAAGDELRLGTAQVKAELADSGVAGLDAAQHLGGAVGEQMDALVEKGRDLLDSAAELIRERPLAAFGVAFAAGWIISKLARSDK